ncbi:hypothetical protein KIW84_060634 [Lathyrus oleraceus]|uniref:GAG-pre-integrase domain-containing protein n=1 Tax=Pisum sativum TaxID=3888 RepID=A0A9D4W1F3_PEA|nr:hypothetical protein KIW84_060634 [Pisum sativum]
MMMIPLPDIDKAFSLVIQQERELNSATPLDSSEATVTAFHVNTQNKGSATNKWKGSSSSNKGGNRVCTHCGRTNHIVDTCFVKHGYPPGYRNRTKPASNTQGSSQSHANTISHTAAQSEGNSTPVFGFTQEEFQSLRDMLQQSQQAQPTTTANAITTSPFASTSQALPNTDKHPNLWILDTGATCHISFHLANFTSYQSIVPIFASLPNGSHLTTSVSGTIAISPSLTLYNILYIPNFHNHSKQMIGTTKLHRGLYVMDSNAFHNSCNYVVSNSFEMWHLRLGHLSNSAKSETKQSVINFVALLENQFNTSLKCFRSDNGSEFSTLNSFFLSKAHRTKFDARARKSIFLGHKDGTKGYILYDLQSHDLFVSRYVIFFENYFPFKSNISQPKPPEPDPPAMTYDIDHTAPPAVDSIPVTSASSVLVPNDNSTPNDSYTPLLDLSNPHPSATSVVPNPSYPHIIDHEPQTSLSPQPFSPSSNDASPEPVPPTRKSTRTKNPPQYLKDFHYNILTTSG